MVSSTVMFETRRPGQSTVSVTVTGSDDPVQVQAAGSPARRRPGIAAALAA